MIDTQDLCSMLAHLCLMEQAFVLRVGHNLLCLDWIECESDVWKLLSFPVSELHVDNFLEMLKL